MMIVPLRLEGDALAATEIVIALEPLPEGALRLDIKGETGVTLHVQPAEDALIWIGPVPPAAIMGIVCGRVVNEQLIPNCVIV
jgi:hypothetical protein